MHIKFTDLHETDLNVIHT